MNGRDIAFLIIARQQSELVMHKEIHAPASPAPPIAHAPTTVVPSTPVTTRKQLVSNTIDRDISSPQNPKTPLLSIAGSGRIVFMQVASTVQYSAVSVLVDGQTYATGDYDFYSSEDKAYFDAPSGTYRIELYELSFKKSFNLYVDPGIPISSFVKHYVLT